MLRGQEAHAVGFQVQRALERADSGTSSKKLVRSVVGGAVAVVGAEVVHRLAEAVRVVLAAVEEEMLEQVREAGAAALLVARADVVPEVHRDERHGVVLVDQHGETVGQGETLVLDAQGLGIQRRGWQPYGGGRGAASTPNAETTRAIEIRLVMNTPPANGTGFRDPWYAIRGAKFAPGFRRCGAGMKRRDPAGGRERGRLAATADRPGGPRSSGGGPSRRGNDPKTPARGCAPAGWAGW